MNMSQNTVLGIPIISGMFRKLQNYIDDFGLFFYTYKVDFESLIKAEMSALWVQNCLHFGREDL